jgi:hypothetical protein
MGWSYVFRKLMTVAVLSAVPVLSFGVAQVVTTGTSAAAGGSTTCTGGPGTVTFATPGISELGKASAKAKSTASTTSGAIKCTGTHKGKGTLSASKIKTTSTTTCATDPTPPSPCPSGDFVYDSANQFVSGSGTLFQAVKTTTWKIGSTTYKTKNTASAQATTCTAGEAGFVLTGSMTAPASVAGQPSTLTACLNKDHGHGTTGNFMNDIVSELSGNATMVITSVQFDPADSSIVFGS